MKTKRQFVINSNQIINSYGHNNFKNTAMTAKPKKSVHLNIKYVKVNNRLYKTTNVPNYFEFKKMPKFIPAINLYIANEVDMTRSISNCLYTVQSSLSHFSSEDMLNIFANFRIPATAKIYDEYLTNFTTKETYSYYIDDDGEIYLLKDYAPDLPLPEITFAELVDSTIKEQYINNSDKVQFTLCEAENDLIPITYLNYETIESISGDELQCGPEAVSYALFGNADYKQLIINLLQKNSKEKNFWSSYYIECLLSVKKFLFLESCNRFGISFYLANHMPKNAEFAVLLQNAHYSLIKVSAFYAVDYDLERTNLVDALTVPEKFYELFYYNDSDNVNKLCYLIYNNFKLYMSDSVMQNENYFKNDQILFIDFVLTLNTDFNLSGDWFYFASYLLGKNPRIDKESCRALIEFIIKRAGNFEFGKKYDLDIYSESKKYWYAETVINVDDLFEGEAKNTLNNALAKFTGVGLMKTSLNDFDNSRIMAASNTRCDNHNICYSNKMFANLIRYYKSGMQNACNWYGAYDLYNDSELDCKKYNFCSFSSLCLLIFLDNYLPENRSVRYLENKIVEIDVTPQLKFELPKIRYYNGLVQTSVEGDYLYDLNEAPKFDDIDHLYDFEDDEENCVAISYKYDMVEITENHYEIGQYNKVLLASKLEGLTLKNNLPQLEFEQFVQIDDDSFIEQFFEREPTSNSDIVNSLYDYLCSNNLAQFYFDSKLVFIDYMVRLCYQKSSFENDWCYCYCALIGDSLTKENVRLFVELLSDKYNIEIKDGLDTTLNIIKSLKKLYFEEVVIDTEDLYDDVERNYSKSNLKNFTKTGMITTTLTNFSSSRLVAVNLSVCRSNKIVYSSKMFFNLAVFFKDDMKSQYNWYSSSNLYSIEDVDCNEMSYCGYSSYCLYLFLKHKDNNAGVRDMINEINQFDITPMEKLTFPKLHYLDKIIQLSTEGEYLAEPNQLQTIEDVDNLYDYEDDEVECVSVSFKGEISDVIENHFEIGQYNHIFTKEEIQDKHFKSNKIELEKYLSMTHEEALDCFFVTAPLEEDVSRIENDSFVELEEIVNEEGEREEEGEEKRKTIKEDEEEEQGERKDLVSVNSESGVNDDCYLKSKLIEAISNCVNHVHTKKDFLKMAEDVYDDFVVRQKTENFEKMEEEAAVAFSEEVLEEILEENEKVVEIELEMEREAEPLINIDAEKAFLDSEELPDNAIDSSALNLIEYIKEEKPKKSQKEVLTLENVPCHINYIRYVTPTQNLMKLIYCSFEKNVLDKNVECLKLNYYSATNLMIDLCNKSINNNNVSDSIQHYLHMRHDYFITYICKFLNIEYETDMPFYNKTPDILVHTEGKLFIYEIAVTADASRALMAKGFSEMTSKYKKEIAMYKEETGESVEYYPIIFNLRDINKTVQELRSHDEFNFDSEDISRLQFDMKKAFSVYMEIKSSLPTSLIKDYFSKGENPDKIGVASNDELVANTISNAKNAWNLKSTRNINRVNLNNQKLNIINQLKMLSKDEFVKLKHNESANRYEINLDKSGVSVNDLLLLMTSENYSEILANEHIITLKEDLSKLKSKKMEIVSRYAVIQTERQADIETYDLIKHNDSLDSDTLNLPEDEDENMKYNEIIDITNYEETIIRKIFSNKYELEPNSEIFLSHATLNEEFYSKFESDLRIAADKLNSGHDPYKLTFTLPIADIDFNSKRLETSKSFINSALFAIDTEYTRFILENIDLDMLRPIEKNFEEENEVVSLMAQLTSSKLDFKTNPNKETENKVTYLSKTLNNKIRQKKIAVVKTPKAITIAAETKHYGINRDVNRSIVYGQSNSFYDTLYNYFNTDSDVNSENIYGREIGSDNKLFEDLKMHMLREGNNKFDSLSNKKIFLAAEFVSRLCYNLAYYSYTTLSSDYVSYNNMGYSDSLLLVRGGKPMTTTERSKMFRIIFPIDYEILKLSDPDSSNYIVFEYQNKNYAITPWMQLHTDVITQGISFYQKLANAMVTDSLTYSNIILRWTHTAALMFHNRRKTEERIHNTRYLVFGTFGKLAMPHKMVDDMVFKTQDLFQAVYIDSISSNFLNLYKNLRVIRNNKYAALSAFHNFLEVPDLYNSNYKHSSLSSLTLTCYNNSFMTKAPVLSQREQTINLKNLLNDNKEFEKTAEIKPYSFTEIDEKFSFNINALNYKEKAFETSFNYDKGLSFVIGKFAKEVLLLNTDAVKIQNKFNEYSKESYANAANASGLKRDDLSRFNRGKGYTVYYEDALTQLPDSLFDDLSNLVEDNEMSLQTKYKLVQQYNITHEEQIKKHLGKEMKFSMSHKIQKGGSREIYVMTLETKIQQNLIEKMFGYLSSVFPNEVISIPSNKRMKFIQNKLFEIKPTGNDKIYYFSLDMKRWGPWMMTNKYYYFIMGFADILPNEFVTLITTVLKEYNKKKIIIKGTLYDELFANNATRDLTKYCKEVYLGNKRENSLYSLDMPYGFMMGILNYLSSLFHAASQLYFKHILSKTKYSNAIFEFVAHSDDSSGLLIAKNDQEMKEITYYYQIYQKAIGHHLSVKKCVVSTIFYEFLSILYVANHILPMHYKILGVCHYIPSGISWHNDMSAVYGLNNSLIAQGADFATAYLTMRSYSRIVNKFYSSWVLELTEKQQIDLHTQFFGLPDAHPIAAISQGSYSNTIRIITYGKYEEMNKLLFMFLYILSDDDNEDSLPSMNIAKRVISSGISILRNDIRRAVKHDNLLESERLKLEPTNITSMDLVWLQNMLTNTSFYNSMANDSLVRRFQRTYQSVKYARIRTEKYVFGVSNLIKAVIAYVVQTNTGMVYDNLYLPENLITAIKGNFGELYNKIMTEITLTRTELIELNNRLDNYKGKVEKLKDENKALKVIKMDVMLGSTAIRLNENANILYTTIVDSKYDFLLYKKPKQVMNANAFKNLVRNLKLTDKRQIKLLSQSVSDDRFKKGFYYSRGLNNNIMSYKDLLDWTSQNTYTHFSLRLPRDKNLDTRSLSLFTSDLDYNSVDFALIFRELDNFKYKNKLVFKNPYTNSEEFYEGVEVVSNEKTQPLINSIASNARTYSELPDVFYYFTTEQKRVFRHWYGTSSMVVKYLENIIVFDIQSGFFVNAAVCINSPEYINETMSYTKWVCDSSALKLDFKFEPATLDDEGYLLYDSINKSFTTSTKHATYVTKLFSIVDEINLPSIIYSKQDITRIRNKYVGNLVIYIAPEHKITTIESINQLELRGSIEFGNKPDVDVNKALKSIFFPGFTNIAYDDLVAEFTSSKIYSVALTGNNSLNEIIEYLKSNFTVQKGKFANIFNEFSIIKKAYDSDLKVVDENFFYRKEAAQIYMRMGAHMIAPLDKVHSRIEASLLDAESQNQIRNALEDAYNYESGVYDVAQLYKLVEKYGYQVISNELVVFSKRTSTIYKAFKFGNVSVKLELYMQLIVCFYKSLIEPSIKPYLEYMHCNYDAIEKYYASLFYTPASSEDANQDLELLLNCKYDELVFENQYQKSDLLQYYASISIDEAKHYLLQFGTSLHKYMISPKMVSSYADAYSYQITKNYRVKPEILVSYDVSSMHNILKRNNYKHLGYQYFIKKQLKSYKPGKRSNVTYYPDENLVSSWASNDRIKSTKGFNRLRRNLQGNLQVNCEVSPDNKIGESLYKNTNCQLVRFIGLPHNNNNFSVMYSRVATLIRMRGKSNIYGFSGYKLYYNEEATLTAFINIGFLNLKSEPLELKRAPEIEFKKPDAFDEKVKMDSNDYDSLDKEVLKKFDEYNIDRKYFQKSEYLAEYFKKKGELEEYKKLTFDRVVQTLVENIKKLEKDTPNLLDSLTPTSTNVEKVMNFGEEIINKDNYITNMDPEFVAECKALELIQNGVLRGVANLSKKQYGVLMKAIKVGLKSVNKNIVALAYVMSTVLASTTVIADENYTMSNDNYLEIIDTLLSGDLDVNDVELPAPEKKNLKYEI